nr:ABC transporter permease [Arthrobacter roseus]
MARRILVHGGYEAKVMLRNGEQLVLAIVLPLLALIGLTVTPLLDGLGDTRINVATPGVLALCAMSTAFTGQGIATGFDRRYGVLRFLSTTPLGKTGLIFGKALAVVCVLVVQVVTISVVAGVMGWRPLPQGIPVAILLLLLGVAAFTALGLLVAGTFRPEATLAVTNLLWILLAAGGGILIPASELPQSVQPFVEILPSSALGEALRGALGQGAFEISPMITLVVWAAAASIAAVKWFKWS